MKNSNILDSVTHWIIFHHQSKMYWVVSNKWEETFTQKKISKIIRKSQYFLDQVGQISLQSQKKAWGK